MKTLDATAKYISAVSSPFLVLPFFHLLVIAVTATNPREMFLWGSIFLIFGALAPFLFIYFGVKSGKYTDYHLTLREHRAVPFFISIVSTAVMLGVYSLAQAPKPVMTMTWILLANGVLFWLITLYWKISIHAAALAGSVTMASLLISPKLTPLYLTVPLVMWARVRRQRHTLAQVSTAAILVVLITYLAYKISHN